MKQITFKRIAMATALAVATIVSCVAEKAQAFTFADNDLVLAIYGNDTEALINLGNYNTLLSAGPSTIRDVSAELAAASVGTAGNVRYTIFGFDLTGLNTGLGIHAGTSVDPGAISGIVDLNNQFQGTAGYTALSFSGNTISKSNGASFFNNMNPDGTGTFNGSWPLAMNSQVGQILNILHGDAGDNSFLLAGRALLSSDGILTIGNPGPAAVPLPAGLVLFASGLIGLAGVARRSFGRQA